MPHTVLTASMWVALAVTQPISTATRLWERFADDEGLDESPSKMIYLAVGVALAIAATAFIIATYDSAQDNVPDPVAPTP